MTVHAELPDPRDTDVELVRPRGGPDGFAGVDSTSAPAVGRVRVSSLVQYEHEPVVYFHQGGYDGAVVGRRLAVALVADVGVTRWLGASVVFPGALNFGSDDTPYGADGLGVGDLGTALRARFLRTRTFGGAVRVEAAWPTGTRNTWTSEPWVRPSVGLVGDAKVGRLTTTLDLAYLARPTEDSGVQWTSSSDVRAGLHARVSLVPNRFELDYAALVGVGVARPDQLATRTIELLAGLAGHPGAGVDVGVGAGVGVSGGVGAPTARGLVAVGWLVGVRRPLVAQAPRAVEAQIPDDDIVIVLTPPPPPQRVAVWKEGELARVEKKEITIRDPIQFEFATERVLTESELTLRAVAALLRTDGRILHVVIQGHASDEGSYLYNYDLSGRRARAVWEALVRSGVHPDRISFQGMGEVEPAGSGETETELAANRRVVFRIVRLLEPGDTVPDLPSTITLPWSGESGAVVTPPPPAPPPTPPEDDIE